MDNLGLLINSSRCFIVCLWRPHSETISLISLRTWKLMRTLIYTIA